MTGLLIVAAFAGAPFLVWFALTPLLAALERRRGSRRALALQGGICGIVLAAAGLPWRGDPSEVLLPEGVGGLLEHALHTAPGWIVLAATGAAFGIGAGGLLGMRTAALALTKAPAIAVVWAGLEALLGLCQLTVSPWPGGWLSIGHAIPPDYPEAHVAHVAGVSGLSFAAALSSAYLAAGLGGGPARRGWMTRSICLALCLGIPFACRWTGSAAPVDGGGAAVMAAAVCAPGSDPDRLVSLIEAMNLDGPSLVAVPALEGSLTPEDLQRGLETRASKRGGGALPRLVALPKGKEMDVDGILLGNHRIGVIHGAGSPLETLMALRHLARSGAKALVIIGDGGGSAPAARRQRTFDAYLAIACSWPVIRSGTGAAIHDPSGRMLAGVSPTLEGSISAEIRLPGVLTDFLLEDRWLLVPALAVLAMVFVIGAGLDWPARRTRGASVNPYRQ